MAIEFAPEPLGIGPTQQMMFAIPGWQRNESPFHAGVRAVQEKLGAAERMEALGRRVIRVFPCAQRLLRFQPARGSANQTG